jgi:hypothetical protein
MRLSLRFPPGSRLETDNLGEQALTVRRLICSFVPDAKATPERTVGPLECKLERRIVR